jgi:hypothetical protein
MGKETLRIFFNLRRSHYVVYSHYTTGIFFFKHDNLLLVALINETF